MRARLCVCSGFLLVAAGCGRAPEQSSTAPHGSASQPSMAPKPRAAAEAPPRNHELVAEDLVSALRPGRITYDPPAQMQVAVPVRIQVRIGELRSEDARRVAELEQQLAAGLERPGIPSQPVRISKTMKVLLTGAPEEFRIVLQSPEEQWIDSSQPTEWRWLVTPLKHGTRRLHLSAIAMVNVGGAEKMREFSVYDTDVNVRINFTDLLTENWGKIASGISASGVTGWLGTRWKRRRRSGKRARAAGGSA